MTLPLGAPLLVAAHNPDRHPLLVWLAALVSLLHAANHVCEAILLASLAQWLTIVLPLALLAVALALVAARIRAEPSV